VAKPVFFTRAVFLPKDPKEGDLDMIAAEPGALRTGVDTLLTDLEKLAGADAEV